jgi:ABC-type transport system substrate-binding protein
MMTAPSVNASVPSSIGSLEGPYFKEIRFKIYATSEAEVAGLLAGDVDVVDFFEAEQIPDIQPGLASGTLNYTQSAEQGMWVFSLQCERYPLNITDFRRALAHLVDKDKYVREGLQGLGYRIDTFLGSPGYGPWSGTDYTTYEFSPTKAGEILDRLGFVRGADGKRIDPKTGTTMRPLVIIARVEHPHRIYAARELAAQMDAIGIPYELNEVPRAVASPRVFLQQDYDIYTAGWGGGPDVDWLYDLFYSESPPSQNFELFKNDTVDAALEMLKFGSTREECLEGAQLAQKYLSEQVPVIPLYAKAYISPYNSRLRRVVDLPWWSGVTNWMTFFYSYDKDQKYGSVLNVGWTSDPQQPSPMYEINWWWDSMLNTIIYDYLINPDPRTFAEVPWLAKNWTIEPWTAPGGVPGLKITFNLVNNATWHDGLPVTAEDVVFSWDYAQRYENPVYISYLLNYVRGEAPNQTTAIAYLNTTSYWALHWMGENIPIMPKHIWQDITDPVHYQPISEGKLIGSGFYKFKEYKPGEYVVVEANPNYFMRPRDSTLGFTTLTLTQGETRTFQRTATYEGAPVTNGTYVLTVRSTTGELVKTVAGSAAANGTYTATLDTADIQPGTYQLFEQLAAKVATVGIGFFEGYQLIVQAQQTTPPPPTDYTLIVGALIVIVVIVAAGYIVLRRRRPT